MRKRLCIWIGMMLSGIVAVFAEQSHFDFYGRSVAAELNAELQTFAFDSRNLSFQKVSSQLSQMHRLNLQQAFTQLKKEANTMNLDALGYFQLLKVFSVRAFPAQTPAFRIALVWYGLRQRGIDAILAGKNDYLNLFVAMAQQPDGGFSMVHRGKTYYSVTKGDIPYSALEVYHLQLLQDSAVNVLTLNTSKLPALGNDVISRDRNFSYARKDYTLHTRYNKNLVEYLNDLPRFRVGIHLYELNPSNEAARSLDDSLKVWMAGMNYSEKTAFLLNLVQKAFPYRADRDYRPHEKRNFIEQTLADDYVDCEDKAAFFCYLAKTYLGANTILIYSKEKVHVNCALEMNAGAPGYTFKYQNKPWLICEPAFSGYKPGETDMTDLDIRKAEIFK